MKDLDKELAKKRDDIAGRIRQPNVNCSKADLLYLVLEADIRQLHTGQRFCSQSSAFKPKKRKKPCRQAGPRKRRRPGDESSSESDSDSDSSHDGSVSTSESVVEVPPESAISLEGGYRFQAEDYDMESGGDPKRARISSIQLKLDEIRRELQELTGKRATCEKDLLASQRAKNAFCSQARSRHAEVALKEQFRSGLEEIYGKRTLLVIFRLRPHIS